MLNNHHHLSDTELQMHLEGQPFNTNQQVHVANCPKCMAQLQLYQQMYIGFEQLPALKLNFDLAQAVMAKMPVSPVAPKSYSTLIEKIWVIATVFAIILPLVLGQYFGYFDALPQLFSTMFSVIPMLAAILGTVLLFQWIEYRFWSHRMVKG